MSGYLTRKEVIERFCILSTSLQDKLEEGSYLATDCFCEGVKHEAGNYRFDEEVVLFIEQAVKEKLEKEGLT